jgi:hypothetical protein
MKNVIQRIVMKSQQFAQCLIAQASLAVLVVMGLSLTACGDKADTAPSQQLVLNGTTAKNIYVISMHPSSGAASVNQIHTWKITLANAKGKPVSKAQIEVSGGMPQHNHGFPTQPKVTKEVAPGSYLLEGMKFSMSGWWQIKFNIEAADGPDSVMLNTLISAETKPEGSSMAMSAPDK